MKNNNYLMESIYKGIFKYNKYRGKTLKMTCSKDIGKIYIEYFG